MEVRSFRGIMYDPDRAGDMDKVLSPPYDIIDDAMQETLYAKSPYNFVRIDLGKRLPGDSEKDNTYTRARVYFEEWLTKGIMLRSDKPTFYPVLQRFKVNQSGIVKELVRYGFFGAFGVSEYGKGSIMPHEKTQSGPKEDRYRLVKECRAHLSAVFSMYNDPGKLIEELFAEDAFGDPVFSYTDYDGVETAIYASGDESVNTRIELMMTDKTAYIADGHHRYETAMRIHRELKAAGDNGGHAHLLMYFSNMADEGLLVLPTYRLVSQDVKIDRDAFIRFLDEHFAVSYMSHEELPAVLSKMSSNSNRKPMAFITKSDIIIAELEEPAKIAHFFPPYMPNCLRELDVVILQQAVFGGFLGITPEDLAAQRKVTYTKSAECALKAVQSGGASLAALMNPPDTMDVVKACEAVETMPQKSTYFYPKVPSGAVIYGF